MPNRPTRGSTPYPRGVPRARNRKQRPTPWSVVLPPGTIREKRQEVGVAGDRRLSSSERERRDARVFRLFAEGATYREIAEATGFRSTSGVHRVVQRESDYNPGARNGG